MARRLSLSLAIAVVIAGTAASQSLAATVKIDLKPFSSAAPSVS